jgi:predicted amidophosphoribosyltransferase
VARLSEIDPSNYQKLEATDRCWNLGEYTSGGGWQASETNQQIYNLKWSPAWRERAIAYWVRQLIEALALPNVAELATLVPAPCSKAPGDPSYDDRMLRIVQGIQLAHPGIDVRQAIVTRVTRGSQHEHGRLSVAQLRDSMELVPAQVQLPFKPHAIVVDDVFTQGGTFKAMQALLAGAPGVTSVNGIFLAKTVWPPADPADFAENF